jgi:hypothetical protein
MNAFPFSYRITIRKIIRECRLVYFIVIDFKGKVRRLADYQVVTFIETLMSFKRNPSNIIQQKPMFTREQAEQIIEEIWAAYRLILTKKNPDFAYLVKCLELS